MNANIKRALRRRKEVPSSAPLDELPLSAHNVDGATSHSTPQPSPKSGGANAAQETGLAAECSSPAPGSDVVTNSAPSAVGHLSAAPSNEGAESAAVGAESTAESPVRTALAVVSAQVDAIQAMDIRVDELEARYGGVIFQVETTAGMTDAKKAREEIRESRYALQNLLRDGKAPLNNLKRHMEETTTQRIDRLFGVETPIDSQIKDQEQRKAEEKRQRDLADQRRKDAIEARIEEIRNRAAEAVGKSSADIDALIEQTIAIAIDDTFAEFKSKAESVQKMTLDKLRYFRDSAVAAEERARELAEQEKALAAERERMAEENRRSEVERVKRETAMQEIQAISHQLLIADVGRAPYCKGGDIESYYWVIKQTEEWPVTQERFGVLAASAEKVKADTLSKLRERLAVLDLSLAEDAEERRQQEEKERAAALERERLAEEGRRLDAQRFEHERQIRAVEEARKLREERIGGINLIRAIVGMSESLVTLAEFDTAIADTAALPTSADEYGDLATEATAARDFTLDILRARRQIVAHSLELEAAAAARETIVAPTDPAKATDGELLSSAALFGSVVNAELPAEPDAPSVDEAIITTLDALAMAYSLDEVRGKELIARMGERVRELAA